MAERCDLCRNVRKAGGQLTCHRYPPPWPHVAAHHWCGEYRQDVPWGTGITEQMVTETLDGLDDRKVVRAAIWALKQLERV